SQTLKTNIGIISDNAVIEYKTMDVTRYMKEDIANGRNYNQYRMRFTIDTDFDGLADGLLMVSGNAQAHPRPFVAIQYDDTTSIKPISNVPMGFQLKQNYPNPFNPVTTIAYTLPKAGKVQLIIFDLTGREIQTLVSSVQPAGSYQVQFDGSGLSSGVYWYCLKYDRQIVTKKMALIR
ncbi:MAG: T9SS type A sorting domain-containing protein, partial [candidate division Zixibacteria bacterium]|nr:T9SS type A sorting domain-containing protein [candidate division Zixibacteria bacterium]NIW44091.1 T9SS type A sorting domain-containing protein [Gammaproteobacteria bacterium]